MTSNWAPFAPDPPSELHVLWLDGDSLGVDGAEVGVLKDVDNVVLSGVLKREEGLTLPAAVQKRTLRSMKGSLKCWRNRHNDHWDRKQIVFGAPVTIIVKP
jgi:hypothetical protein